MNILNTSTILSVILLGGSQLTAAPETMEIGEPHAIEIVEPEVPVNYVRWGIPGYVVVSFQINEDGETEQIRLEDYDDRLYANRVEEAVRKWRFEKPEIAGVTYRQAVNFTNKHEASRIE